jgi:hypothetical protein
MTETTPYEVLKCLEDVEIRQYPKLLLATVGHHNDDSAFRHLFSYITGDNKSNHRIAMRTPVITPEKIEMTAPVISDDWSMSFVLPPSYTLETAPEPMDHHVKIQEIPARKVAIIPFKGRAGERSVREETEMLMEGLKRNGLAPIGKPFLMRYNSPFTPGFLRRNEVGIEIK